MGRRTIILLAREVPTVVEELGEETHDEPFHGSACISCFVTEKILNRFLDNQTRLLPRRFRIMLDLIPSRIQRIALRRRLRSFFSSIMPPFQEAWTICSRCCEPGTHPLIRLIMNRLKFSCEQLSKCPDVIGQAGRHGGGTLPPPGL